MGDKGQSSMEFMAMVAVLILVFVAMQYYVFTKINEANSIASRARMGDVCEGVAAQITVAGYSKNYSGSFRIPLSRAGTQYNVSVYPDMLVLDYGGDSCISAFSAGSLYYNGSAPPFTLSSGDYWISNSGGVVTIAPQ